MQGLLCTHNLSALHTLVHGTMHTPNHPNYHGMASKMIGAIGRTVLGRKELTKGTKVRVVNAMVIPTLTYGREAWTLQARHKG